MDRTKEEIVEERRKLKAEYNGIFEEVSALIFQNDPIGINFETNDDEYEPEVGTILPRLRSCRSVEEVQSVVYEEFVYWFGPTSAGSHERYSEIAAEIWERWHRFGTV
jgi:hypothetical protein